MTRYLTALATAGLLTSSAAGAVSFTFGSNTASTQTQTVGGITTPVGVENFVKSGTTSDVSAYSNNGCGVNSGSVSKTDLSAITGQSYRVDNTSARGQRLDPIGSQCYLSVADPTQGFADPTLSTDLSFNAGNTNAAGNPYESYIGFYWGSVDDYNYIQLTKSATDENGNPIVVATLTGTQVAQMANIGVDTATGIFINIFLNPGDEVTDVIIGNTQNYAFELANLSATSDPVDGQTQTAIASPSFGFAKSSLAVPEPSAAMSLLAGMGLLGFARRKRG